MNTSVMKKLLKEIGSFKWLFVISTLLAVVSVMFQLYLPIVFGNAIDGMIGEGNVDFDLIVSVLSTACVCICISALASFLMTLLNNRIAYHTVQSLRSKAMHRIQDLPLKYLDSRKTGDIVARITADADAVSDGLVLGFSQLISGVVTVVMTLLFLAMTSLTVTAAVVIMTPVSFIVAKMISSRTYSMFTKQSVTRGKQMGLCEEMTSGIMTVNTLGCEEQVRQSFHQVNEELRGYATKATFYSSLTNPSTRCVNSITYAVTALIGALMILRGNLSVGGLSAVLNYANQYMKPFNDITSVITELQNAFACAGRLYDLIEEESEPDPVMGEQTKENISDVKGEIIMDDVSFRYVEEKPFIEHFSLNVKPGMHVALVGPTGCGKTTVINLLMRFFECNEGRILLDGKDITELNRTSLRTCFGMVLQDTWLPSGTIRDNLRLAKEDATDEEIYEACRRTQCLDWIEKTENGLDTVITEDRLSAGQKQLLCISRVMLSEPSILILDEATSSIDTRTEVMVQKAFDELMKGRTSIVVAHRLSTIRNADLIVVMKDGKIIEQGTHEQLLAKKGFYDNLFNSQFAGIQSI